MPNIFSTVLSTIGERVCPPTRITLSICVASSLASLKARSHGSTVCSTRRLTKSSNCSRLRVLFKCFGPDSSAAMNGRLNTASLAEESSHLARSAASFKRCNARRSLRKSMPVSFMNSFAIQFMMLSSKSSPPRNVFPEVDKTSKTPLFISRIEISKVPPPRS